MPGVVMGGYGPQPLNYRGGQMGNLTQFLATIMREVPRTMGLRGWDVRESKSAWTLRIDVSGYGPEDVDVEVSILNPLPLSNLIAVLFLATALFYSFLS